jgi:protein SCO1
MRLRVFLAIFCICSLLSGCQRAAPPPSEAATYQLKGIVVASDASKGEVAIDGEEIHGFMGAMIMSYKLAQPGVATELHPGDHITARLRVADAGSQIDQIVVTAQARPDYKPTRNYNVPEAGQVVPNFKLMNQDGKTLSIDQFRGKVLLITFIYTRCPLPDYCIRMSRNFADVQKQLARDPQLSNKTHLLSISFDPAYDTPKVLRSYGAQYAGKGAFSHWDFAAPAPKDLDTLDEFFDVAVSAGENKTLTHSLSTVVIGPDGKVFRWYPNNEWTPSAAMDDIRQAAAQ